MSTERFKGLHDFAAFLDSSSNAIEVEIETADSAYQEQLRDLRRKLQDSYYEGIKSCLVLLGQFPIFTNPDEIPPNGFFTAEELEELRQLDTELRSKRAVLVNTARSLLDGI